MAASSDKTIGQTTETGDRGTPVPFKDSSGKYQVGTLDSSGNLKVNVAAGGAGDGSILDGVSSAIKATVLDFANSNPLAVRLTDTAGDYIAAGAGTQYTEDAVAAADPIGTAKILVRQDTPAGLVSLDGDNVVQRGTNYGAAFTQVLTSAGAFVDTFGGGTQYADAAARGTATGTLAMGDDGTNIQSVKVDAAGELQIDVLSIAAGNNNIGDVDIVSGTVTTVSTVTNLSQQGGVAISLNTGVRDAGTQRVTIATNDAVPVTFTGSTDVATQTTLASALTSVQLIDDAIYASDAALNKTMGIAAVLDDVATVAITENQAGYLRMSSRRALLVEGVTSGTAITISGALTANQSVNVAQINGVTPLMGTGIMGTGSHRVTLASDQTAVSTVGVFSVKVDQTTPGTTNAASLSHLAANAVAVGNGASSTGVLRVAQVNDGTGVLAGVTTVTTVSTLTNQSQEGGVAISLNAGAVDTGTRRVVQANGAGKTILSTGGSAAGAGNNTLVAAGTNKLKVFAFSLTTTSTTAMTCIFQSGAAGTELWRVIIQAPTGANAGANLSTAVPGWLFATASATLLNLNLSSANAVHWSVSYYDEA